MDAKNFNILAEKGLEDQSLKSCKYIEIDVVLPAIRLKQPVGTETLRYTKMPVGKPIPGIPEKDFKREIPEIREVTPSILAIQSHRALRAGPHFDLRIIDPKSGVALSWAGRDIPEKPGESRLFNRTSDHTKEYALTFGKDKVEEIPRGVYGAGTVKMHSVSPIEIIHSSPRMITFNAYDKVRPREFALIHWEGDKWLLRNFTPTEEKYPISERKKYESLDIDKIDVSDPNMSLSPKYDGASAEIHLLPGRRPRVISTRKTRAGGIIDHSAKFRELLEFKVPKEIGPVVLAGEVLALNKKGRFAGANVTAGILNSETLKAREKVEQVGSIENFVFDIVRGLNADAPYEEKMNFIRYVSSVVPRMRPAEVAATSRDKANLIKRITSGKHPHTNEGLVSAVKRDSEIKLVKHKVLPETDVYIRDIISGTGRLKDSMGAIYYSHTPRGPIIGKVGTGFSDRNRDLIWKRKADLIGSVISLKSMGEYSKTGALRMPVFLRIHPDKNPTVAPELIEELG
jgi:hypothetical protein